MIFILSMFRCLALVFRVVVCIYFRVDVLVELVMGISDEDVSFFFRGLSIIVVFLLKFYLLID